MTVSYHKASGAVVLPWECGFFQFFHFIRVFLTPHNRYSVYQKFGGSNNERMSDRASRSDALRWLACAYSSGWLPEH